MARATTFAARALCFGASERGPFHRAQGRPNEDAWLGEMGTIGALVAVSDGLGSRSRSRLGSRSACAAVHEAVCAWSATGGTTVESLIAAIEPIWTRRIAPESPSECAATCLFALMRPTGELVVAGLGDGIAVVKRAGRELDWVVGPRATTTFSNQTLALGTDVPASAWTLGTFECQDDLAVVLATDGVADDLLPERVGDFVTWLVREFSPMKPSARWRALRQELRNWPTPNHLDDKTLAVLWIARARREA